MCVPCAFAPQPLGCSSSDQRLPKSSKGCELSLEGPSAEKEVNVHSCVGPPWVGFGLRLGLGLVGWGWGWG